VKSGYKLRDTWMTVERLARLTDTYYSHQIIVAFLQDILVLPRLTLRASPND